MPTTNSSRLRGAVISDVHLGHNRTSTGWIIESMRQILVNDEVLAGLDVLFIAGDLFDRRLPFASDDAELVSHWTYEFLRALARNRVALRLLEGTPSHDCRQTRYLELVNSLSGIGVDLKYYDKLTIDTFGPDKLTFLYVPDELNHDADVTWQQVCELVRSHGLDKVDFAVMHGAFEYQYPIASIGCHKVERYEALVRYRIFIGHVHTHTRTDKIVAQGSVDRLKHGEEEDKGYWQFTYKDHQITEERFVVNPHARVYLTLECLGLGFDEVQQLLAQYQDLADGSNIRLHVLRSDAAYLDSKTLKARFPQLYITYKVKELEQSRLKTEHRLPELTQMAAIRSDNVVELIRPRISDLTAEQANNLYRLLERHR